MTKKDLIVVMHWVRYMVGAAIAAALTTTPAWKAVVVRCLTWPPFRDAAAESFFGKPPDDENLLPFLSSQSSSSLLTARDKRVLVVGGTRGTGFGTAWSLVTQAGAAHVTLVGRNATVGRHAVAALREQTSPEYSQTVEYLQGDIGTIQSTLTLIRQLIAKATTNARYDILVVSAGTFPDWQDLRNADGWEKSFAIAVIGRYLLYRHMAEYMTNSDNRRVLNILASGMQVPYALDRSLATRHGDKSPWCLPQAMIQTNTAHELMLMGLEQRDLIPSDTTFVSTHPGVIATELHRGQGVFTQALMHLAEVLLGISLEQCGQNQASILLSSRLTRGRVSYVDAFRMTRQRPASLTRLEEGYEWLWSEILESLPEL